MDTTTVSEPVFVIPVSTSATAFALVEPLVEPTALVKLTVHANAMSASTTMEVSALDAPVEPSTALKEKPASMSAARTQSMT
jgi:hypothetical protein